MLQEFRWAVVIVNDREHGRKLAGIQFEVENSLSSIEGFEFVVPGTRRAPLDRRAHPLLKSLGEYPYYGQTIVEAIESAVITGGGVP